MRGGARSEGRLERSDSKSNVPFTRIANNLPLVASLLAPRSLLITPLFASIIAASVHAIPAFEEKEEEKPPEETIEEKMAKQKAIDEAALDAADRMKKENEEFLRKLRGGDDEDKSVDSQGRELSDTVVDTINGSSLFKFERYFIYLQFTSLLLTINVRWPQAFCYSFGLGSWLTQELHVMPFHLAFDILRFPELVDIVDLAEYYWLVNFALKLCSVVIFLSAFFNFWVIKDYTDPKYTDNWIMIYIDHWWNIVLFWKSGFMRCVFFTGVLWGIVVAIGSILWVAMDQTRGVAFIVSGSLYLGVWLSIYIILVQAVRIAFKRKTKNNEYYTMRIMTKNVVEAKNQVCLFLLTALYLPTVVSVLKVILPMYDWNDTHTPDPRHDDSKFLRNVTTGSPTNYENVFYSVFPGAFASHGNNTLTAQVNYHIPCYLMAFPPNVSPNTNITTSIVDCNSPTGYSLLTATSLLVPIYVIGFPIMCIYLAWISYETMKDSNWFPNYTAQVMSYVNSNRHLRKEALKDGKIILLVKVKVLVFFQELLAGLKADIKGILLIIFMQETKQISKLQQRRIKLKKQATRQKEEKWLEARPEWKKTWDGFGNGGRFTAFIYIMIFANLAIMGHEREMFVVDFVTETDEDGNVVNNDDLLKYLNYFFAFIFFVEFVIKLTGMGAKFYFRDPFNMFDTFLVSFSIFEIFVVPYIFGDDAAAAATDDDAAIAAAEEEGGGGSGVGGAKALRMLKSVRILKMLRLGKILKTIKLKINRHLKRVEEMYSFDDYDWPEWRRKLKKKVTGNLFTNFIYLCIFVNLAGVFAGDDFKQAEPDLGYPMMYYSDRVFAVIFSFEMIVKWVGLGPKLYFMDPFEMLNFLLVCSGWAEIIAIPGSPDPPLEDAIEGGGGAGAAKMARLARFARFARFARVLRLLKIFKPQTQTAWRFQKSLEFKAMKVNQKFKSSCEEYVSTVKAFTVDHELVILTWDSLLDASSTVYLIQPFKHNFRYWKAIHFLEILSFTSCSIIMRRNFAPSEQLQVLLAILGFFQILHLVCLPYLFSRERKLDFFCRFCCMWNCGMGLLIDDGSLTETSAAFLILWGNLALLIIFSFVMQLPQVIKKAIYGLRNRVDSGVVKFLFKQLERKNLAMENVHTGLLTLQQWDNMVEDEQWMGFVGLSKTKPRNLLSARQRLRYMKWAAIRNMKLINIRDPVGVTVLHEAMARAEPEMCRWLVYHDRDFVDMEDDGRDTPLLIGLKECARALLACRNNPTDEWSWRRARFADIFLSEQIHGSHPNWNRFHYATLEDLAVPTLGELTQQLASAFDLHPPEGYVRVSNWNKYGANIMEYLAEMFVASRLEMDLYNRELGDIGFDSLLAMCSKMSVKHTSFTVPTNFKLFYNINVMKLDLRTNRLKHDAGMAIAKMLETNSTLEVLDLSDNAIDDDAGFAIFEALRHNHKVHTLKFNHNLLGPGAGKELAHCLKRNHVLKEVHCGYNSMGAKRFWKDAEVEEVIEGAGHDLGMSLRHNKSLTVLDLEGNRLGTGTGDAFAQMMRKNATLLQLNLGTNEILVDGGRYIANSVSKNKGLTYLNLEDNQLGPKAGMAFARSLKDNHVLAHLNLRTNKLGYKAGQAFAIAMMHNTSLISINLENNDFGPNVGKKWATAIQRNVGLTDIDFSNNDLGKHSHLGGEPDELGIMLKRALEANSQLTALNFSGCHFDSMTFIAVCGAFMKMKSLRVLKLDDLLLDEPSTLQLCNALEGFPVRNLSLARCEIGDSAKAANLLANCLRNLQTLVRLDLSGNILGSRRDMCEAMNEAFSHEGMHIRELNLRGNRFGPEGGSLIATGLGHLHTLEWLDVSDNQLDDDVCRELAESLREVISFGIVKRACSIKHFEGSNNPFGDEAASELIMAFYNEITNYIGLENCDLGPLTGHSIGKGLGRPTIAWEEMNISKNILKKEGANHIWWAMRKNHSLFRLNIESNRIGPQFGTDEDELGLHGISIDTALERNFTLRVLNMDDNGISAKAGEMFAATLSANKSLQHICFQNNDLDHVVGEYMGERLEYDRQIVSLNFNGNYFGWEGGKAIANALFTNRFLVSLDLGNNKLGENGARVGMLFAKALYQNNVLKSLKLAGNR